MATELGEFLRARRARLSPRDAGLPPGTGQRRTPGLRREELAALAGVSIDYYIRLEQGRERHPSGAVVASLAEALHLNEEEHAYLYSLARSADRAARAGAARKPVRPGTLRLLEAVRPWPAYVLSRTGDVLAANPEVLDLFTGMADWPPDRRNTVRYTFCHPAARDLFDDWEQRATDAVANLRTVVAAEPDAPDLLALVAELTRVSPDFARLWERHDVRRRRSETKVFHHPVAGRLALDLEVLYLEDGCRVGIYQPVSDS